jgi:acetyl esterase/lipase
MLNKKLHLIVVLIALLIFSNAAFPQPVHRYTQSLFTPVKAYTGVIYATAPQLNNPYAGESVTTSTNLIMDIYQPSGDTLSLRPVLICCHGGAFISGTKDNDDMVAFCDSLANKGYVTVTINYRLGMNVSSAVSGTRSVYRGLQDSRAVIRYLKENAATYHIDTNNVYFLGSSAGAFIALQNVYMDTEAKRPAATYQVNNIPPTLDNGPDLGRLDAIDSTLIHGGQPKAIVSLWGAVADTVLIQLADTGIPVFLVHGTADAIVPFNVGSPFNAPSLPATYGSNPISIRLNNLGKPAAMTYFVTGAGHEFYGVVNGMWSPAPNAYWDTIVTLVTKFLYSQNKPTAKFSESITNMTVQFHDSSTGCISWYWDFGDNTTSTAQNPSHTYTTDNNYKVTLTGINRIQSWDTVSTVIHIPGPTYIDDKSDNSPLTFSLSQNYPNPFNPGTLIGYTLQVASKTTLKVYDILGREVATLVNENQKAGEYKVEFNANNFPSGIYFYKLQAGSFVETKKMILLK